MLILQRKAGETVVIGENISISVLSIDGGHVRLAISAPEQIPILRSELLTAAETNRESTVEEHVAEELVHLLGGAPAKVRPELLVPLSPKRQL